MCHDPEAALADASKASSASGAALCRSWTAAAGAHLIPRREPLSQHPKNSGPVEGRELGRDQAPGHDGCGLRRMYPRGHHRSARPMMTLRTSLPAGVARLGCLGPAPPHPLQACVPHTNLVRAATASLSLIFSSLSLPRSPTDCSCLCAFWQHDVAREEGLAMQVCRDYTGKIEIIREKDRKESRHPAYVPRAATVTPRLTETA